MSEQNPEETQPEAQDEAQEAAAPIEEPQEPSPLVAGWSGQLLPQFPLLQTPGADLVANARDRVAAACGNKAATMGEEVEYGVSLTMVPNQEQTQLVPVIIVVLAVRSAVIDEKMHLTSMISNLWAQQADYDNLVLQSVQQLVAARTAMMQQMTQANGQGISPQGFGG